MSDVKAWKCEHGHVLGQVVRNGRGIRRLLLYREAIGEQSFEQLDEELPEVDVIAMIEGYAADVRCSICGNVRTWVPGQEAIDRLVEMAVNRHKAIS